MIRETSLIFMLSIVPNIINSSELNSCLSYISFQLKQPRFKILYSRFTIPQLSHCLIKVDVYLAKRLLSFLLLSLRKFNVSIVLQETHTMTVLNDQLKHSLYLL